MAFKVGDTVTRKGLPKGHPAASRTGKITALGSGHTNTGKKASAFHVQWKGDKKGATQYQYHASELQAAKSTRGKNGAKFGAKRSTY